MTDDGSRHQVGRTSAIAFPFVGRGGTACLVRCADSWSLGQVLAHLGKAVKLHTNWKPLLYLKIFVPLIKRRLFTKPMDPGLIPVARCLGQASGDSGEID